MARLQSAGSRMGAVVPYGLRCEYQADPMGIGEIRPRLSWKLRAKEAAKGDVEVDRGLSQKAYQVRVASSREKLKAGLADLWDSRKVASKDTVFVEYGGKALASGERAWWSVVVWDQDGRASAGSEAAFWEMGLLARSEWRGLWIGSQLVGGPKTPAPVPYFRKSFRLVEGKRIVSARLYATALGLYEFRLNGKKVGDYVFPPFWTDYRKRVQYQAYDITEMLRAGGENVIGAILGDGWYCGFTGNIGRRQFYGDRPKALAQIVVRYSNGTSETIGTDGSWMTAEGPIVASDMMLGESYDARREMPGWDKPGFKEDGRWSRATVFEDPGMAIVAMNGPGVRAVREIKPVSVKKVNKPWDVVECLFDFGQNMVGRARLKVKGPAGATVTMRFGEILDKDGQLYTENLRSAAQTDHYTLRGDPTGEIYESRFTFHGFRYVEMQKYPGEVPADALTGIVLHSDMEKTGTFECSDPLVNQLQHNIEWGQRGNFVDVPTDCPQRDERLGWTGDAQVFARTAAFNFDVSGFFAKWTQDLRDAQGQLGAYPHYAPVNVVPVIANGVEERADGGPAWADAGVICPWTMLQCYGDRRLIARHYDSMVKFMDRMVATSEKYGMVRSHPEWNGWKGFGDWLSQDGKDGLKGSTPMDLIGTAFLWHDARLMAGMAKMLRKNRDAARFAKLSETAAEAFCRRFVTVEGLIVGQTQTAYVLALHFDLLPAKLRPAAVDVLVRNIKANGNRLNTGFVGTPYLQHVLTAAGRLDVAYELLMQKNWPSWLYSVTHGATTIWERWDGWTEEKGFQSASMNSFNHYAYGAVGDWLYQVVAGLDVDPRRPGYEHVIFRPHPLAGGPLTHAKASLETIRGRLESGWRLEKNGRVIYEMVVPVNVTATAYFPAKDAKAMTESSNAVGKAKGVKVLRAEKGAAVLELQSGRYAFEAVI